jgi:hypothetical protein
MPAMDSRLATRADCPDYLVPAFVRSGLQFQLCAKSQLRLRNESSTRLLHHESQSLSALGVPIFFAAGSGCASSGLATHRQPTSAQKLRKLWHAWDSYRAMDSLLDRRVPPLASCFRHQPRLLPTMRQRPRGTGDRKQTDGGYRSPQPRLSTPARPELRA